MITMLIKHEKMLFFLAGTKRSEMNEKSNRFFIFILMMAHLDLFLNSIRISSKFLFNNSLFSFEHSIFHSLVVHSLGTFCSFVLFSVNFMSYHVHHIALTVIDSLKMKKNEEKCRKSLDSRWFCVFWCACVFMFAHCNNSE